MTRRRFDPRREQKRAGPVQGRGQRRRPRRVRSGSVGRLCCRRARPRPTRTRWRCRARASGRERRTRSMRRRCWRVRYARMRGARLGDRCAHPAVETPAASANHAACAARARSASPASVMASSANARMLSSSRYRLECTSCWPARVVTDGDAPSSSTITSERLASRPTTSIAAAAGTSSASRTNSTAGRGAPPAKVASAHRPRWSSGNNRS